MRDRSDHGGANGLVFYPAEVHHDVTPKATRLRCTPEGAICHRPVRALRTKSGPWRIPRMS